MIVVVVIVVVVVVVVVNCYELGVFVLIWVGCCALQIDFTMCTGIIFAAFVCFMMFGFACMIVYFVSGPNFVSFHVVVQWGGREEGVELQGPIVVDTFKTS